jgi:hypothetical protein
MGLGRHVHRNSSLVRVCMLAIAGVCAALRVPVRLHVAGGGGSCVGSPGVCVLQECPVLLAVCVFHLQILRSNFFQWFVVHP